MCRVEKLNGLLVSGMAMPTGPQLGLLNDEPRGFINQRHKFSQ